MKNGDGIPGLVGWEWMGAPAKIPGLADGLTHYLVDVKQQFSDAGGHLGMVDQILDQLVHHQAPPRTTGSARDPEGDHDHDH